MSETNANLTNGAPADDTVCIVGIGVMLPGASDKAEFLDMLTSKRSGIGKVPKDRWNADKYTGRGDIPSKICTDRGGFLHYIHDFDNLEFGISRKEAYDMDHHQMALLSTSLQALEDSGLAYRGSSCGVYVAGSHEAHNIPRDMYEISAYNGTGSSPSIQANRLSFAFDLTGPSMYLDTACSGGLTAVHLARSAILEGDCDTALAAGTSLIFSPNASISFSKLGTLSPDGVCRTFDADANGYVRGEGCAVVVLKRTSAALRDNNHIYAEVTGSCINANGRGSSLTMPERRMQMHTMRRAYAQARRAPHEAVYVECHGTGTTVGDPIEANGVGEVFSEGRAEARRLAIGSVKTNVGHLETGAGIVGLIKTALSLDTGLILPSLNFRTPNPKIHWDAFKIRVATEVEEYPSDALTHDGRYVASVSSFGFGGANGHLVLERAPHHAPPASALAKDDLFLVAAGGMTSRSLAAVTEGISAAFAAAPDVVDAALIARVATERARGHTLTQYAVGAAGAPLKFSEQKLIASKDLRMQKLFVFSGQGPQHGAMGRRLYARYPAFRASIERSDEVVRKFYGRSFVHDYGLFAPGGTAAVPAGDDGVWDVDGIVISITMFQIALYDLWVAVGLVPDAVAGHSVGEIAALYASGAFSLEQTLRLALARSHALADLRSVGGTMAALGTDAASGERLVRDVLDEQRVSDGLWISAVNSVEAVTVSGRKELIAALVEKAQARGMFARPLRVGGPYHSPLVDVCKASFCDEVHAVLGEGGVSQRTFVSTVNGTVYEPGRRFETDYCWDNVRNPVLFQPALDAYFAHGKQQEQSMLVVEIAPHNVLLSYMDEIAKAAGVAETTTVVSSARRPNLRAGEAPDAPAEVEQFLHAAGTSLCAGARDLSVDLLESLAPVSLPLGYNHKRLPNFPLQGVEQEFSEDPVSANRRLAFDPRPLSSPLFRMSPKTHSWTLGHQIREAIVVPGTAYLEAAFESGARTLRHVQIHRALMLREDDLPKYCGLRHTDVPNQWTFSSASKVTTDDRGVILDTKHASGFGYPEPSTRGPANATELLGENFMDDFDLTMEADHFFSKIRSTGASYTREFAMITKLLTSSKRGRDYLSFVDPLPDLWTTKEAQGMCVHPGLLDSLLLSTWAIVFSFEDQSKLVKDTYMPSSFEEVSLLVDPAELRSVRGFMIHFICLEANEIGTCLDITLFDRDTGRTLVIVRGLRSRRVIENDGQEMVAYTETWEPRFLGPMAHLAPALDEKEAVAAVADMSLVHAADRLSAEAERNAQEMYALDAVRDAVALGAVALLESVLEHAAAEGRQVVRVLEVYVHQKKARLSGLVARAAKRGIHLEVVPLNLAKNKAQGDAPYDIASAAKDAERVRPASFEFVCAIDVLRSSPTPQDALDELEDMLVPGGVLAVFELSAANAVVCAACYGADKHTTDFLQSAGFDSGMHTTVVRQRTTPWLCRAGHVDVDPSGVTKLDDTTVVYRFCAGTETELVEAVKSLGANPTGSVWVLGEDDAQGARGLSLAGTIENEFPNIHAYGVVFASDVPEERRLAVLAELIQLAPTGAVEPFTRVCGGGTIFQRRIVRAPGIVEQPLTSPWVLDLDGRQLAASVSALVPHQYLPPPLGPHEVLVRTEAVALNFKNVLSATGLLPANDRLSEFAGTVVEKGSDVTRFQIGDRVMGSSNLCREGTHATAGDLLLTAVPDNMSTLEAAAFPIVYGTVYHGLVQLANIRRGDAILIQAAAGGVGVSAIQIAQRRGLEVFCTVGSQQKRDFLHKTFGIPYENMSNSRSIEAWRGESRRWLQARNKNGFDVVLNSLQGVGLQAGLDSLAPLGRFVDISKRDHLAGSPMTMAHFAKAICYFAIELGMLAHKDPERMAQLMEEVTQEHVHAPFQYLVGHPFSGVNGLQEAYLLMESGTHIGKIAVDLSEACSAGTRSPQLPPKAVFDPRATYVLLGGCGGLGPRLAIMMIANGARNIILTGRRGKLDMVDKRSIDAIGGDPLYPGVRVRVMAADALSEDDMRGVFDAANEMAPLAGIFHMAVALADDQFVNMDEAKFKRVTDSKLGVLEVIERLVDVSSLDFLMLFSSTAALYFNPGQANYNAAQAYFNRMAKDHRNIISIAVPAITDVGVFAQLVEAKGKTAATKSMLALACSSRELCMRIRDALSRTVTNQPVPYYIPGNLDWTVSYKIAESCRTSFSHLAEHDDDDEVVETGLQEVDAVTGMLCKLLNLEPDSIDDSAFLSALGLDSMSASRLSAVLDAEHGVKMTQLQLLGPVSVGALRAVLAATGDENGGPKQALADKAEDYAADVTKFESEAITDETLGEFDIAQINAENDKLRVFITSGTGFLGSAVLASMLRALPRAHFTALLRGDCVAGAEQRLREAFSKNMHDTAELGRVHVVLGDVTKPRLGLSDADWTQLAAETDLVVQTHGKADHVAGYRSLVQVNTYSTSQVLKLVATTKPKALCYFGSTNMWINTAGEKNVKVIREDFDLSALASGLLGGYRQSKWVSERLVERARARGVPVLVVRPGTLGGIAGMGEELNRETYQLGRSKDSFINRIIAGCEQFGYAPISQANFSETPISWFGDMFGRLLTKPAAWSGKYPAFHIKNPHALTDMNSSRVETTFKWIPMDEWATSFKAYANTEEGSTNPLTPLVGYIDLLVSLPDFDMQFTRSVLGEEFVECPTS